MAEGFILALLAPVTGEHTPGDASLRRYRPDNAYPMDLVLRVLPIIGAAVSFVVLGWAAVRYELHTTINQLKLTVDYHNRFMSFADAYAKGQGVPADYIWLAENQPAMSAELGGGGQLALYQAPFGRFAAANYSLLANTVARFATQTAGPDEVRMTGHLLITHGGVLRHRIKQLESTASNPLALVLQGVQFIIQLPLLLLVWSGLMRPSSFRSALESGSFRLLRFVVALAGVVAAVMTIVRGGAAFVDQLQRLMAWLGRLL